MDLPQVNAAAQVEFSKREKQVLQLIAKGKTSKQIADELKLSVETVESHRKRMIRKVNTRNVYGVMAYSFFAGMLKPEDIELSILQ